MIFLGVCQGEETRRRAEEAQGSAPRRGAQRRAGVRPCAPGQRGRVPASRRSCQQNRCRRGETSAAARWHGEPLSPPRASSRPAGGGPTAAPRPPAPPRSPPRGQSVGSPGRRAAPWRAPRLRVRGHCGRGRGAKSTSHLTAAHLEKPAREVSGRGGGGTMGGTSGGELESPAGGVGLGQVTVSCEHAEFALPDPGPRRSVFLPWSGWREVLK